jgi:DNA-directed RNA polymerase specialized sigma24 family protein
MTDGHHGKPGDWENLRRDLISRLWTFLPSRLDRYGCRDKATHGQLVLKTWTAFRTRPRDPLWQSLAEAKSVWEVLRPEAGHQVLLYRCRVLLQPDAPAAAAPGGGAGRRELTAEERAGLCFFLSRGLEGRESDLNLLFHTVQPRVCGYIRALLRQHNCLDRDTADDIFERVLEGFCARKPERLLTVLEKMGSVFGFLCRLVRDNLWQFEHREQLRRKAEAAVAHRPDEPAPLSLSQAELARILKDMKVHIPRPHVQWLLDHLANPRGAADKIPLTDIERQRLHTLRQDVRDYIDRHWPV